MNALIAAVRKGDLKQVKQRIEKAGGLPGEDRWNVLSQAVSGGHLSIVKFFAKHGDITFEDLEYMYDSAVDGEQTAIEEYLEPFVTVEDSE